MAALALMVDASAKDLTSTETGGPDAVKNLLADEAEAKLGFFQRDSLEGWKTWKETVDERFGLNFGLDYSFLAYAASDAVGKDNASSGAARLYGTWNFLGRGTEDTGGLVFKVEHRHRYGSFAPTDFAGQLGYAGVLHATYNNNGWRATNLYWRQSFDDQRFVFYAGYIDTTDYLDVYALASPWTGFSNLAFATGSGSIGGLPDGSLGVMGAVWLTDSLYMIGSIADANGDATDLGGGFDTFFDEFETLKTLEFYWIPDKSKLLLDKFNVAVWQIDAASTKGTPSGWGISASSSMTIRDEWLLFLRGGWADNGGSLYDRSVSVGFGHQCKGSPNLLGFGLNWASPNPGTFPGNPGDQVTSEIFYRWQATPNVQLTPSVQLLFDPAFNPQDDFIAIAGLRGRVAF